MDSIRMIIILAQECNNLVLSMMQLWHKHADIEQQMVEQEQKTILLLLGMTQDPLFYWIKSGHVSKMRQLWRNYVRTCQQLDHLATWVTTWITFIDAYVQELVA